MVEIRSLLERLCHEVDLRNPHNKDWDAVTLEEFIKQNGGGPTALGTAQLWTRGLLGVEPRELSALYFLDYVKSGGGLMLTRSDMKNGGQFLRIRQGRQIPRAEFSLSGRRVLTNVSMLELTPAQNQGHNPFPKDSNRS
jgi:monoamine oxidase